MDPLTVRRFTSLILAGALLAGCSAEAPAAAAQASAAQAPAAQAPATAGGTGPATATSPSAAAATASLAHLVGEKLIVRMEGAVPSTALLGRIRRGEIGGVILFGSNITSRSALIELIKELQATAAARGRPRLLIGVDQEGGSIKRISWAPPTLSAPQMGRLGSVSTAFAQGASTGAALRALGVNVDFAPVADVPGTTSSIMYRQGRTWSFSAVNTAALADAFASGLESKGVLPVMKHFPGIGFATRNTDESVVKITVSQSRLAPGLRPYRTAIGHHIPLIMLSNATYTAYDGSHAAGWSRTIVNALLRHDLGFAGVTITDSLTGTAAARGVSNRSLAVSAAIAGTDLILVTGSEASTSAVYSTLLADARNGTIPTSRLRASYARILALAKGF